MFFEFEADSPLIDVALSMYEDEPCRICGRLLTMEDLKNGAVFAGYSDDNTSRPAHTSIASR